MDRLIEVTLEVDIERPMSTAVTGGETKTRNRVLPADEIFPLKMSETDNQNF